MDTIPAGSPPPPPPLPPPPVIAPPVPATPRKSRGWMIFALLLLVVLVPSLLGNFISAVSGAFSARHAGARGEAFGSTHEAGPKLEEYSLDDNKSANKIAVITVSGVISGQTDNEGNSAVEVVKAQLDRAADDKRVKAVVLKMDSPGGEVLASDEIYKVIRDFEADEPVVKGKPGRKGKPVICSMGTLAASGGYYISSGCRWIVANELTITGSIGVIMHGYNYRGLMDKVGIAPMTFKSGKYKDMLSGERAPNEIPAGEKAMVQALIDETYGKFKDVVADGRGAAHDLNKKEGKALASNWEEYADGRVVSGTQALDLGLVDELGDFDDAVDRAEKIAGIKDSTLVEYRERYDLSSFLSLFGQSSQAHDIKLSLGVDIPKLRAGCMYFLYQP